MAASRSSATHPISQLRAFRAGAIRVNYHAVYGTSLVLKPDHDFLVVDRGGLGANCGRNLVRRCGGNLGGLSRLPGQPRKESAAVDRK